MTQPTSAVTTTTVFLVDGAVILTVIAAMDLMREIVVCSMKIFTTCQQIWL